MTFWFCPWLPPSFFLILVSRLISCLYLSCVTFLRLSSPFRSYCVSVPPICGPFAVSKQGACNRRQQELRRIFSCVANLQELTYIRYVAQNIAIVAVAYGIATAVPVFSTLLGVFGAVTSTIIAYILPTFFYMRTSNTSFLKDRFSWVALTLLILGSSAGMVSSVAQFLWTSVHEFLRQVLRS
jgi:hypothetical protein